MSQPNIVLVIMDTVRAKNLPMYGYQRNTMPFLNKISKKSILYENAYSNAPWTIPSHATLFTGKNQSEHYVIGIEDKLRTETLAEKMKRMGYHTFGVSNNPLITALTGFDKGFDKFYSIIEQKNELLSEDETLIKKIFQLRTYEKSFIKRVFKLFVFSVRRKKVKEFIKILLSRIASRIRNTSFHDKGANKTNKIIEKEIKTLKQPFFIFINYLEAHSPYDAPKRIKKMFNAPQDRVEIVEFMRENHTKDLELINNAYDAGLYYLDTKLKELYYIFKKNNLLKNTIFIFTSDHGEFLGEHGYFGHELDLYPEVIKIPLIIKFPNNKHTHIKKEVSLKDVYFMILNNFKLSQKNIFIEYYGLDTFTTKIPLSLRYRGIKKDILKETSQYMAATIENGVELILREDGEEIVYVNNGTASTEEISILRQRLLKEVGKIKLKRTHYFNRKRLINKLRGIKHGKNRNLR
ncbi:MAG: sulfatase [Nanoarchaeota archaeon]|nr:sulfatase [Nanoarchaeota archaeon]